MGALLGYLLGRRREQPDVEWAHQLDAYADELRRVVDDLERQNAVLIDAVEATQRVVPMLRPADDAERAAVAELLAALAAADAALDG